MARVISLLLLLCFFAVAGVAFGAVGATNAPAAIVPADALFIEARSVLDSRQYAKAQSLFNEFLKKFQADERAAEARVHAGICDYHQGHAPRAVEAWTRVVNMELMQQRRSPALLLGLEQLSAYYRDKQKLPDLAKTLEHLHSLFPESLSTHREHLLAANARFEAGDYAAAAALYEKAGQLKPKDVDNQSLAKELASPSNLSARLLMDKATGYWKSDSPRVASLLYEEALKRNPSVNERREIMTQMGWCLYMQEQEDKAEKLWKEVVASGPKGDKWRGESRWRLVVLSAGARNNRAKARELCAEQFEEFKGAFLGRQAKLTQAWLYLVDKQWAEAKRHFEELAETYSEQNNPRIAEYIERCEEGMRKK